MIDFECNRFGIPTNHIINVSFHMIPYNNVEFCCFFTPIKMFYSAFNRLHVRMTSFSGYICFIHLLFNKKLANLIFLLIFLFVFRFVSLRSSLHSLSCIRGGKRRSLIEQFSPQFNVCA